MATIRRGPSSSNGGSGIGTTAASTGGRKRSRPSSSSSTGILLSAGGRILFHLVLLTVTFYGGILVGMHGAGGASASPCSDTSPAAAGGNVRGGGSGISDEQIESIVEKRVEVELARRAKQNASSNSVAAASGGGDSVSRTSRGMSDFAAGMARMRRDELIATYDYGTASQHFDSKLSEEVIVLYTKSALPSDPTTSAAITGNDGNLAPMVDVATGTANCDVLNVITVNPRNTATCTAIISDYENFHMQRWMRIPVELRRSRSSTLNRKLPLRHVGRGVQANALDSFPAPRLFFQKDNMNTLRTYFSSLDDVLAELTPIAKKVAKDNAIIVLVCNKGQSDLLMNFACSARSQGLDTANVLVFATDEHTHEVATGMGFASFYDKRNFGDMPEKEAHAYGDRVFTQMMYAKVVPVQLLNMMGYDVLFQDVDVVWMKNPLSVFHDKSSKLYDFDILFQDDGARNVRFAPYSGNTGFYYVRHNKRTQYLFTQLLYNGDMIKETNSHQQALTALLAEHSSLTGLKVKTLDGEDFPSGFHYHRKKELMKNIVEGKHQPYLFHMCWTKNKDNKILFMKQMGMWYMKEECTGTAALNKLDKDHTPVSSCCSAEPMVSCHYRDKPSIIPCKDSPPIDAGRPSFWK